ncbi:CHAP domain-containing protein [Bariatricus massiliensis]|nr:CHAP domain-containing protein [Bariatricus massiliensis]
MRQDGNPDEPHGPEQEDTEGEAPGDSGPKTKQEARTEKAQARADRAGAKLDTAKEKLAAQKPPKPPGPTKKAFRAVRGGTWIYAHNKIHQVEHENVGTEGAHKTELLAEAGARKLTRYTKRRIREHPARVVEKWEHRTVRTNADLHFQKMAQEHPELQSTTVSRFLQKQKIRRDYQKKARQAAKEGAKAAQKTGTAMEKLGRAVGGAIKRHPIGALLLLLLFAMFMILNSAFSAIPILSSGMMNAVVGTSYTSEDTDLLAVEDSYVSLESGLQTRIDNIERDNPGYDEYRYSLDEIIHNPHELASYLTALYKTYTPSEVRAELQRVFEKQYTLTLTEIVEVRYRTETDTWTDEDGNSHTDTYEVAYDYYILDVELTNRPITSFAPGLLNAEQLEMYHVYLATGGNKPLLFGGGSPDGTPSEDLSGVQFEDGTRPGNPAVIEIAKSQVGNVGGQPFWSWYGFDSRVAWCACFVSWCYDRAGMSEPRFASCSTQGIPWFQSHGQWGGRSYPDIAPGDAIFFDWEGDGRADHVGLVVGTDGERVYTVEGNSGDACKIKSYPIGSNLIYGYGLMNWN